MKIVIRTGKGRANGTAEGLVLVIVRIWLGLRQVHMRTTRIAGLNASANSGRQRSPSRRQFHEDYRREAASIEWTRAAWRGKREQSSEKEVSDSSDGLDFFFFFF